LLDAGPYHRGVQQFVTDLNRLYRQWTALWRCDYEPGGFQWIDCTDRDNSVLSFLRQTGNGDQQVVVILNLTPVLRENYRVGLPQGGHWREVLNSDSAIYGGSNQGNAGGVHAVPVPAHGQTHSAEFRLPPLGVTVFVPAGKA